MTELMGITECILPSGHFLNSCGNFDLEVYHSKADGYVPTMCKFEADCDDGYSSIRVHNEVYLPINTHFTEMSNIGGHLAYGKNILSNALALENPHEYSAVMDNLKNGMALRSNADEEIPPFLIKGCDYPLLTSPDYVKNEAAAKPKYEFKANSYECKAPTGSYSKSCKIEIVRYKSSDNNLKDTELCEINLACSDVRGTPVKSSTVYFNIGDKEVSTTVQKLENCNGAIVIGTLDNQCSGDKGSDQIKNKAKEFGNTGRFKSN